VHHAKGQHRDGHDRSILNGWQDEAQSTPPPFLNGWQGQDRSTPSPTGGKVKLGPAPSSGGWTFRASSSWRTKSVEVIDLISSDEDIDNVLPHLPSYRYEVDSDDEDSDDVLPPPALRQNCRKRKAPDVANCSNKKVDNNLNTL
jgi:hypothetical protein